MTYGNRANPPAGHCPICSANDAYIDLHPEKNDYFIECLNCGVYTASRKAFRHFEYLRWRSDPEGLAKLERLAARLNTRSPGTSIRLEYETWQQLIDIAAQS